MGPQIDIQSHNCTCPFETYETLTQQVSAHPRNEACSLVEEASNVLVCVVIDMDGHVGKMPLVEARDYGRRIQDMGNASLFEALQVARGPHGPCIRSLSVSADQLIRPVSCICP